MGMQAPSLPKLAALLALPGPAPRPTRNTHTPPAPSLPPAGDDIVIGKTSPIPDDGSGMPQRYSKKDGSTSLRHSESGMIDSVLVTTGADGQRFVKMRVRAVPCRWGGVSREGASGLRVGHMAPAGAVCIQSRVTDHVCALSVAPSPLPSPRPLSPTPPPPLTHTLLAGAFGAGATGGRQVCLTARPEGNHRHHLHAGAVCGRAGGCVAEWVRVGGDEEAGRGARSAAFWGQDNSLTAHLSALH